jgi:hypothetical protein
MKMLYEKKIDWTKARGAVLVSTRDPFKSAVLDYQIEVEGDLEDIIKRHPQAYKTDRMPFRKRIKRVRTLIGKTPDGGIWAVVKSLGCLRNKYAHSRSTETAAGKKEIQKMTADLHRKIFFFWHTESAKSGEAPLELREGAEDMKGQCAGSRRGVELLSQCCLAYALEQILR